MKEKEDDNLKNEIKDIIASSHITGKEKIIIIEKLEEALKSNKISESDKNEIVKIKDELKKANNEKQILNVIVRLIELFVILAKSFFG